MKNTEITIEQTFKSIQAGVVYSYPATLTKNRIFSISVSDSDQERFILSANTLKKRSGLTKSQVIEILNNNK